MDANAVAGPSRIPYTSIDTVQTQDAITVTAKQVFPIARPDGPVNGSENAQRSLYTNGNNDQDAREQFSAIDGPQHRARAVYNANHPALKRFRTGKRALLVVTKYLCILIHILRVFRLLLRLSNDSAHVST
jgi:hypothetical protein